MADLTLLIDAARRGEPEAADALLTQVYAELRMIARAKMAREQPGQTLQPTALVHEAWMRLGDQPFANRAHFFGAAAEAMRRILVDRARKRHAQRRGAGSEHVDVDDVEVAAPVKDEELLAVHEALDRFADVEPEKAELVKLRYFTGMTLEEVSEVLDISVPTAKRWWVYARTWLFREISEA
uniref:RNA polymerase ECF family sigma subunit n=1 Tax=Roseimicrobium gellanilyticum TaxID=748857 RepID=A0A366HPR5_9BACT|nr:sigma-70 family RNA polymerase sigma factor [Roseimicrobium gellanilyticum]RBP44184.1 RNA polymerase ECF family sigma subunit [Roseimicrobium gellanilyticum]